MGLNLLENRGTPLERQHFTWRELVQTPISKLDDDAFTRVRVILMNGQELEALRFQHSCARMNQALQLPLVALKVAGGVGDADEPRESHSNRSHDRPGHGRAVRHYRFHD